MNFFLAGILDLTVALVGYGVWVFIVEFNAPLKNSLRCTRIGCTPVFITIKSSLGKDLSSSGVSSGRSIIEVIVTDRFWNG